VVARLPERRWMSTEGLDTFTEYISPVFTLGRDRELLNLTLRRGEGLSGGGVKQELDSCHKQTKGRKPGDTYLSLDKLIQVLDRFRLNDSTVCMGNDRAKRHRVRCPAQFSSVGWPPRSFELNRPQRFQPRSEQPPVSRGQRFSSCQNRTISR